MRRKGIYRDAIHLPGVTFAHMSCSAKLSPVTQGLTGAPSGKKQTRPMPKGPYCASTYVSISATCPSTCTFRDNGCYAQTGSSRRIMKKLDEQAQGNTGPSLAWNESAAMARAFGRGQVPQDGAKGGRDLRLHVGGDVPNTFGATLLAAETETWLRRGGGTVWTYTHRWREIPAESWGRIAVWASCETKEDIREAHRLSYRASVVVEQHKSEKMYDWHGFKVLPCAFETRGKTCVECRLCLDAPLDPRVVIGFAVHGQGEKAAKKRLRVLNGVEAARG